MAVSHSASAILPKGWPSPEWREVGELGRHGRPGMGASGLGDALVPPPFPQARRTRTRRPSAVLATSPSWRATSIDEDLRLAEAAPHQAQRLCKARSTWAPPAGPPRGWGRASGPRCGRGGCRRMLGPPNRPRAPSRNCRAVVDLALGSGARACSSVLSGSPGSSFTGYGRAQSKRLGPSIPPLNGC